MHAQHFDGSRTSRGAVSAPPRRITRSDGKVRLKLDGKPALTPCGAYPGEDRIAALPQAALVNPLQIRIPPHAASAIRELRCETRTLTTISEAAP